VRFLSSSFLQHAVAKDGAILENDGELTLPPLIQPIAEIGNPFSAVSAVALNDRSYFDFVSSSIAGAGAGADINSNQFAAGTWHFNIQFFGHFEGTNSLGAFVTYRIIDPGGLAARLFDFHHVSSLQTLSGTREFIISTNVDGFFFRVNLGTTVALDVASASMCIYGNKLL